VIKGQYWEERGQAGVRILYIFLYYLCSSTPEIMITSQNLSHCSWLRQRKFLVRLANGRIFELAMAGYL
jgi:hypothetical protein